MTLQDFIKEKEIVGITKQKISNKTMKKYLNHFKYIDAHELWYDVSDNPISNKGNRYESLSDYLCNCVGVSEPKNVCACAMDLAKYNDMTMAELFEKYE